MVIHACARTLFHAMTCVFSEITFGWVVAPRTFFRVRNIETDPNHGLRIIHLENISSERRSVLGTLAFFLKQELKNRIRH